MWSGPFATQHLFFFLEHRSGFHQLRVHIFPCPASEAEFSFIWW